jgi:hypothetical protein
MTSALNGKLPAGRCLSIIGTEGDTKVAQSDVGFVANPVQKRLHNSRFSDTSLSR